MNVDLSKFTCCTGCQRFHSSERGCDVQLLFDSVSRTVYECSKLVASFNMRAPCFVENIHQAEALVGTPELAMKTLDDLSTTSPPYALERTIDNVYSVLQAICEEITHLAEEGFPVVVGSDRLKVPDEFKDLQALGHRIRPLLYWLSIIRGTVEHNRMARGRPCYIMQWPKTDV